MTATVDDADVAPGVPIEERAGGLARILSRTEYRWLLAITAVAFGLRLLWLLYAKAAPPTSWLGVGDQYSYWYYGNEIAAGRGYVSYVTHQPTAYYPIGYPALLAVLFFAVEHAHLPGDLMLWAGLMHVVFATATVALVFFIGRRVFNPTVGLIAAGLLAVFPNAIYQVTTLQLETTFIFLSTSALAIIVLHDWSSGLPSRNRLLTFGFVLGLSVLIRPFSVWFVVGVFFAALAVKAGWRRALALTLVPVLVVVGMSIPWMIRNQIRMHAFIVTSTNTGDTLCLDRNLTAYGGFRFADHDGCVDPGLPEVPRNAGNTRQSDQLRDPPSGPGSTADRSARQIHVRRRSRRDRGHGNPRERAVPARRRAQRAVRHGRLVLLHRPRSRGCRSGAAAGRGAATAGATPRPGCPHRAARRPAPAVGQSAVPLAAVSVSRAARGRGDRSRGAQARQSLKTPMLRGRRAVAVVAVIVAAPVVGAMVSLLGRHWYATSDRALELLRVTDVGGSHTPLLGAWSRWGWAHPGPLLFWLLAPFYRVFGQTGVLIGMAILNLACMLAAVLIGYRRGGARLAVLVGLMVALLAHGVDAQVVDPWNPWAAFFPFVVFLLLVWSVLCDDLVMLPIAVAVGSFSVQTHVGYLPIVAGLLVLSVCAVVGRVARNFPPAERRRSLRWLAIAAGVGVLVWLPAIVDQLSGGNNLRALLSYSLRPA